MKHSELAITARAILWHLVCIARKWHRGRLAVRFHLEHIAREVDRGPLARKFGGNPPGSSERTATSVP